MTDDEQNAYDALMEQINNLTENVNNITLERDAMKEENERISMDAEKMKKDLDDAKKLNFILASRGSGIKMDFGEALKGLMGYGENKK